MLLLVARGAVTSRPNGNKGHSRLELRSSVVANDPGPRGYAAAGIAWRPLGATGTTATEVWAGNGGVGRGCGRVAPATTSARSASATRPVTSDERRVERGRKGQANTKWRRLTPERPNTPVSRNQEASKGQATGSTGGAEALQPMPWEVRSA